jgi:predicted GNAT superfamily acetyltransferase
LPTDRLVCEWWLRSPRVEAAVAGASAPRPAVEQSIVVPVEIGALRRDDPKRARAVQESAAASFADGFARGLAVVGFDAPPPAGAYHLAKWHSE